MYVLIVTAVFMGFGSAPARRVYIPKFTADHPYIFEIIDRNLKLIYFCGRAIY